MDSEERAEKQVKVEENFKKWLQRKNEELNDLKAKQEAAEEETRRKKEVQNQRMEVAIAEWNCKKNQELRRKLKLEMEKKAKEREKKEREENEKQQNATLAFQAWMKSVTEKDHKRKERQWKSHSVLEKDRMKIQERKSEAEMSFSVWKRKKDQELRNQLRKLRIKQERAESEMSEKIETRSYEAEQAYLNWLDSLDF